MLNKFFDKFKSKKDDEETKIQKKIYNKKN